MFQPHIGRPGGLTVGATLADIHAPPSQASQLPKESRLRAVETPTTPAPLHRTKPPDPPTTEKSLGPRGSAAEEVESNDPFVLLAKQLSEIAREQRNQSERIQKLSDRADARSSRSSSRASSANRLELPVTIPEEDRGD